MDKWLKISELGYAQQGAEKLAQKVLKQPNINSKHDLHGMTESEAHLEISRIISTSYANNERQALIIHGFGKNILRNVVREYCYEHHLLLAYLNAPAKLGGDGATLVIFKRRKNCD